MQIIVKRSPLEPTLLVSDKASWAEVRSDAGVLALVLIFPPGGTTCLVLSREDKDFEETVRSFGIAIQGSVIP